MKTILRAVVVLAYCFAACAPVLGVQPGDGGVTNGVYYSAYFNFSVPMPQGAVMATTSENSFYARLGMNDWGEKDPALKAALDASSKNSFQLLSARKHSGQTDNWTINIAVNDLRASPEIADVDVYMERLKSFFSAAPKLYDFSPETKRVELGGINFREMLIKKETPQGVSYCKLWVSVRNGWALFLCTIANDMDHLEEGQVSLSRIVFDGPPAHDNTAGSSTRTAK